MKVYEDLSVAEGIELGLRQAIQIQRGELQAGRIATVEIPDETLSVLQNNKAFLRFPRNLVFQR